MNVLGIGTGVVHDSSACLLAEGQLLAAVEEERFSRRKHQSGYPREAIASVLRQARLEPHEVDLVAVHFRPWLKLAASLALYARGLLKSPTRSAYYGALELSPKLLNHLEARRRLRRAFPRAELRFVEHHLAHAASAFLVSPFDEAAVLSIDNRGEHVSTVLWHGRGSRLRRLVASWLPHSLGMVYSAFTGRYLGFGPFDEYKVMGLAAYGKPCYLPFFRRLVGTDEEGRLRIERGLFRYEAQGVLGDEVFRVLGPPRRPEEPLEERHADVAASLQAVTEEVGLALARRLHQLTRARYLCLAGGVALNGVMNGRILREGPFERVFIQPAASDAGGALGAALIHSEDKRRTLMRHAAWGPEFSPEEMRSELDRLGLAWKRPDSIAREVAARLAEGQVVGWFQGRMEFGPRALGHRSILADPRREEMKERVNRSVKYREPFRPFAPAVLAERAADWFETGGHPSPFMVLVFPVRPERHRQIPAVTHADGTARVQTVERETESLFHQLISEFERVSGVPVLLNTSFNVKGEPIVCTPTDAVRSFYGSGLDALAMGPYLVAKR